MTTSAPHRLSKAAVLSLICGVLGCVPFLCGLAAVLLGLVGFVNAGKPGMRGRWMAVVGGFLGLVSIAGWTMGAIWMVQGGRMVFAAMRQPEKVTAEFIQALAAGDEKLAIARAALSDDEIKADEAIVQAQGDFVNVTSESLSLNEGGSAHVSETVQFKKGTLSIKADLSEGPEGWRITSAEILPAK